MKLTIQDGRDSFYTFDSNRILLLTATDEEQIKQVEFSTEEAGGTETWTKDVLEQEDGVKYVQVPNEFLNGDYTRLVCYAVALDSKGEFTRQKEVFRIKYRPQPEDWFLTYSERVTFASIKALTEQYKTNASDSADLARRYAEEDEDVNVETGTYSSKHWSIKSGKKFQEIKDYVGISSNPESALGSIESARASAVSNVKKQETDSIKAIGTYTSNTAIPSVSQYVEGTAKPALKTYGEQQVDSYVNGTVKPELDRYVNSEKKQVLDDYTAEKKADLDTYTETDKKQILDSYTENEKKTELNTHVEGLKGQLDSYTVAKSGELNEYTTSLKGTLDGYTTAKEQDISEFTEQKKTEVQGVYQTDLNELKGDLINLDDIYPVLAKSLFTRQTLDGGTHNFFNTTNRIAYPKATNYNNDILIKCESGYKFTVSVWGDATTDASVWVSTTPWLTEKYIISSNTYFTILIAKADDSEITIEDYDKVKLYRTLDNIDTKELALKVDEIEATVVNFEGNVKNYIEFSSGSWAVINATDDSQYTSRVKHNTRYATNTHYMFTKDVKISMPNYTHYSVYIITLSDIETMTIANKSQWLTSGYFVVPANTPFVATVQLNDSEYTLTDAVNALDIVVIGSLFDVDERVSVLEENTEIINADLTKNETYASLFNDSGEAEPFLFFTDPHYVSVGENGGCRSGYENHLSIIKKHYDDSSAGFVLCGGDWLNNGNTQANACYTLSKIKGKMREMFDKYHLVLGNHDTNYQGTTVSGGETSTGQLTQQTIYNLWYGENGKSYYSFEGANTKFYVFDCGIDWGHSGLTEIDNEQIDFFIEQLKANDDKHIALVPHMVYISGENLHPLTNRITEIASVYNNRGTIQHNGTTYDFSQKTGKVEFMIAGHTHADLVGTLNSIPYIQSVNADVSASYPTFDLVFVDYTARKLKTIRIGTGEDREINLV